MAYSHLSYKKNNLKITIPTNTNVFFVDHARLKSISQHHKKARYLCKKSCNRFATKKTLNSVDQRIDKVAITIKEAKDSLKSMIVSKTRSKVQGSIFNPETQQNLKLKNIIYEQRKVHNKYHEETSRKLDNLLKENNTLISNQKDLIIAINAMRNTIISQQQTIERLLRQREHDEDFPPRKRTFSYTQQQKKHSPSVALLNQSATYYF